ncbi:cytochrome P450 6k1-like [Diorhabda sublineata]|uniref:cytochrome P450 6k1-like n=1 Tax=Diorhabda sublineata TaxID=1163346 RepID=UPI0024E0D302|nr:cytochrome P450 6k1-like [Diorhabda sublineata]
MMVVILSWLISIITVIGTGIFLLNLYISQAHKYWETKGIFTPKTSPIVGHILDLILFRTTVAELLKHYYDQIDERFFGIYIFDEPILVVKDPDLIKNVLIEDFHHFSSRYIGISHDEIQKNMLFFQKYTEWKSTRAKLSPVFTISKLKSMVPLLEAIVDDLVQFLNENQGVIEAKEITAKFTTDAIAKCAFGIEAGSFVQKKSVFREAGRKLFENSLRNAISQLIHVFKPSWTQKLKLYFFYQPSVRYFKSVFLDTLYNRNDSYRCNDLIDILKDMRKNEKSEDIDENKLAASAFQFFVASFETTSATISFTLHELCVNEEAQRRLRTEINEVVEKFGGITMESLKEMRYLDMCINETLRKYPVLPYLDRVCTLDYTIPGTDIQIEKGRGIMIPMYGLHMDPNYFPEPSKYDPERFAYKNSNMNEIHLPFGGGPRNCIGERFGKLSMQVALVNIIKNFTVEMCQETPNPIKFDRKTFLLTSDVGLPMKITKIKCS